MCRRHFGTARCYDVLMLDQPTAMHVVSIKSRHTDKHGRERQYESRLLRRTWRDGGTVRNETLANLSKLLDRIVDAVEAALKGQALVPASDAAVSITRAAARARRRRARDGPHARPARAARPGRRTATWPWP